MDKCCICERPAMKRGLCDICLVFDDIMYDLPKRAAPIDTDALRLEERFNWDRQACESRERIAEKFPSSLKRDIHNNCVSAT